MLKESQGFYLKGGGGGYLQLAKIRHGKGKKNSLQLCTKVRCVIIYNTISADIILWIIYYPDLKGEGLV